MTSKPKLSEVQKKRLKILEPQLSKAVKEKDFKLALNVVSDMQDMLKTTGHITKTCAVQKLAF